MKFLLLAPELFAGDGGIERMLRLYLKALCEVARVDDRVGFIALNDVTVDSISLQRYSGSTLSGWIACRRNRWLFVREAIAQGFRSDMIVCGHVAQLPVAWAASAISRQARYVLIAHGIEVWRSFSVLERIALRNAAQIWCVSEYTRREIMKRCRLDPTRVVVVPNALDPQLEPRATPGPSGAAPIILAISRLSASDNYKGIDHLIRALPKIRTQIPEVRLRIVGRGDGLAGLQALATKHGVTDIVDFVGFLADNELPEEFARCRLFALPSQKEGFGLVYVEAMAHGRPCLVASEGGAPEIISEQTGLQVAYGDITAITQAITTALERNWPIEPLLGRARFFSYERFRTRIEELLSKQRTTNPRP